MMKNARIQDYSGLSPLLLKALHIMPYLLSDIFFAKTGYARRGGPCFERNDLSPVSRLTEQSEHPVNIDVQKLPE